MSTMAPPTGSRCPPDPYIQANTGHIGDLLLLAYKCIAGQQHRQCPLSQSDRSHRCLQLEQRGIMGY